MDIIKSIEHEQLKNTIPDLKVGNTVRVHVKIKEGNKERIQVFEGIIIKKQGGGVNATFTVRKISYGVGVEKTFLIHSPLVEKVEVVRVGKARRAKLYYLRDRVGKAAKTKEQIGARIEDREITIKEDLAEEPVAEEVKEEGKAVNFQCDKAPKAKVKVQNPKVVIPVFPGTNCEDDCQRAFEKEGAVFQRAGQRQAESRQRRSLHSRGQQFPSGQGGKRESQPDFQGCGRLGILPGSDVFGADRQAGVESLGFVFLRPADRSV